MNEFVEDATRQLQICNACRYCEGLCGVYPALERRRTVGCGDLIHLANLCHDCRSCLYACMYAPPHEFGVNVPRVLAEVRSLTYGRQLAGLQDAGGATSEPLPDGPSLSGRPSTDLLAGQGCARPSTEHVRSTGPLVGETANRIGARRWRASATALAVALGLVVVLAGVTEGFTALLGSGSGSPYEVISYPVLVAVAAVPLGWSIVVMALDARRYWLMTAGSIRALFDPAALMGAARDAANLQYLRGGGAECTYPTDRPSAARRRLHGVLAYGFLACFASTISAGILQDGMGHEPPYPVFSAPVLFGIVGGAGLVAGSIGLLVLKVRSDPEPGDPGMAVRDRALLAALLVIAVTGLLTLALRRSPAYPLLLVLHLSAVITGFAAVPYSKFVHVVYRFLALVQDRRERMAS